MELDPNFKLKMPTCEEVVIPTEEDLYLELEKTKRELADTQANLDSTIAALADSENTIRELGVSLRHSKETIKRLQETAVANESDDNDQDYSEFEDLNSHALRLNTGLQKQLKLNRELRRKNKDLEKEVKRLRKDVTRKNTELRNLDMAVTVPEVNGISLLEANTELKSRVKDLEADLAAAKRVITMLSKG